MEISYRFDATASIDKSIVNEFQDSHKETMEQLIPLEAYPQFYDDSNFKTIRRR